MIHILESNPNDRHIMAKWLRDESKIKFYGLAIEFMEEIDDVSDTDIVILTDKMPPFNAEQVAIFIALQGHHPYVIFYTTETDAPRIEHVSEVVHKVSQHPNILEAVEIGMESIATRMENIQTLHHNWTQEKGRPNLERIRIIQTKRREEPTKSDGDRPRLQASV